MKCSPCSAALRPCGFWANLPDAALRNLESQWHKLYIGWHSVLGQLKVQQRHQAAKSMLSFLFEKKS